jgi:hypothetical protein
MALKDAMDERRHRRAGINAVGRIRDEVEAEAAARA